MADRLDTGAGRDEDRRAEPDRGSPPGTPRWVKVLGIAIAIILLLLIVVLHTTGTMGPGVHGGGPKSSLPAPVGVGAPL
jgi:hypothetical protein